MGSQVHGAATLRGVITPLLLTRRILLCGKSEAIIKSIVKNMALAPTSSSNWRVVENTAKSDCLIFRAQSSSGNATKGDESPPLFFWSKCTICRRDTMYVHALRTDVFAWRPARARAHPEREGRILIQQPHAKIQTNMPNALLRHRVSQNLPSK